MPEPDKPTNQLNLTAWATLLFMLLYTAAALACLRRWGSPHPWSRLDVFSGGYLLLSLPWMLGARRFQRGILASKEILREASGMSYDRMLLFAISALSIAELSVFLDYSQLRLVPALEEPALQALGLALSLAGALWLYWVDTFLTRHFAGGLSNRAVMQDGPYRYVRHPRYVALLVSRIAFALALASILAWIFFFVWLLLILRRIRLEEAHLRKLFGPTYDSYAARTPRLIPGLY